MAAPAHSMAASVVSASSAAAAAASSSMFDVTPASAAAAVESASSGPVSASALHDAVIAGQLAHNSSASAAKLEVANNLELQCSWKTNRYDLTIPHDATVGALKHMLAMLTNVRPHHQKIVNLKIAISGLKLTDDLILGALGIKPKAKFMLIGNPEESMIQGDEGKGADVLDDLDYEYRPEQLQEIQGDPLIKKKLDSTYEAIKDAFCLINPMRNGKKLLVLDLDYTLFDMKGQSLDWKVLRRPYTHRFLTEMYKSYELVIWSQTSWRWLEMKLTELGILTHPNYKVCFVLDKSSMFSIHSKQSDGSQMKHHVKPLELIWRKFPQFSAANTIHIDDLGRNFALNPQSGLKIIPYKNSDSARATDRELHYLTRYLENIAKLSDLSKLDHGRWKKELAASGFAQ